MKIAVPVLYVVFGCCLSCSQAIASSGFQETVVQEVEAEQTQEAQQEDQVEEELELTAPVAPDDFYTQMQREALKGSLKRVGDEFKIDEETQKKIEKSLEDQIKAAAERLQNDSSTGAVMGAIERQLEKELLDAIQAKIADDQKERFTSYRIELGKMNQLFDQNSVTGLVSFLDNQLCLSEKQFEALRKLYSQTWDSKYNEQVNVMVINGLIFGREVLDQIDEKKVKELLTESQWDALENIESTSSFLSAAQMAGAQAGQEAFDLEGFQKFCNSRMDLKIEELNREVQLTDSQRKMLSIAKKGACKQIVATWKDIIERTQNDEEMPFGFDYSIMMTMTEPIVSQCTRQKSWAGTTRRILNEDQLKKIQAREELRSKHAKTHVLCFLTHAIFSQQFQIRLRPDEFNRFFEMLEENVELNHNADYFGAMFQMMDLEDEKYQSAMSEEHWKLFEPKIQEQRQQMEQIREQVDKAREEREAEEIENN